MAENLDRIVASYGSGRVRESLDGGQQRRALGEEAEWFVEARELLERLQAAVGPSPTLSDSLHLLERKQVEQGLVEAWSYWHGGPGDPVEAARSLAAFLCAPGARALFDPDDPDDRVVHYAQALLRALLEAGLSVPLFNEERPLPPYLEGTLLAHHVNSYERFRGRGGGDTGA